MAAASPPRVSLSSQTALGYHGYIAILVLVRSALVSSGAWTEVTVASSTVRRGKKVTRRLSNKGAAGLAFRATVGNGM